MTTNVSVSNMADSTVLSMLHKLFLKTSCAANQDVVVERTAGVVEMSSTAAVIVVSFLFDQLLTKPLTNCQHQTVILALERVVRENRRCMRFQSQVIACFDEMDKFPVDIVVKLRDDVAIVLGLWGTRSVQGELVLEVLRNVIVEKLTEEIVKEMPEGVLDDIRDLGLRDLAILDKYKRIMASKSSICATAELDALAYQSVYDVTMELDSRMLSSSLKLLAVFDLYDNFNEEDVADFILAISSRGCSFRSYFSGLAASQKSQVVANLNALFLEKGIDLTKVIQCMDRPNVKSMDGEGCALVLSLLKGFLKEKAIELRYMVSKWDNEMLQLEFIAYLASTSVIGLGYGSCTKAKVDREYSSAMPNDCWMYLEFVSCAMRLSMRFGRRIVALCTKAAEEYAVAMLLSFSQVPYFDDAVFREISILLTTVICKNSSAVVIFARLWESDIAFMRWLCRLLGTQQVVNITVLLSLVGDKFCELLEPENLEFGIDLAFCASLRGTLDFGDFFGTMAARFPLNGAMAVLRYVKVAVLDEGRFAPALLSGTLNTIFGYFWENFSALSDDMKLLVNNIYASCEPIVSHLKPFAFAGSLPRIDTPETKEAVGKYFTRFLDEEFTVNQLVKVFDDLRFHSPTLFHAMQRYLVMELNFIDQHDGINVERFGVLVGTMVQSNIFTLKDTKIIFRSFVKAYRTQMDSPFYIMATTALKICFQKLSVDPQSLGQLIQEPLFRDSQPKLYDTVRKFSAGGGSHAHVITELVMHSKLKRFENLPTPPPRVCRMIQQLDGDPGLVRSVVDSHLKWVDWIALHLVTVVQDRPVQIAAWVPHLHAFPEFSKIVVQAAIFESIGLIESDIFTTYEGAFARRRLALLGKLIGQLTLEVNKPILRRFIDLKHLLLYSFSQGKLFGVIQFVGEILRSASAEFQLPNPYIAGILQVIASIAMTDLLKFHVKNQIAQIMEHFDVRPAELITTSLYPDVRYNNFDFVAVPFSLQHVVSAVDMERILQFDENVFASVAAQNIVIPDVPPGVTQTREAMRAAITSAALEFLNIEGMATAKMAADTTTMLISKDFTHAEHYPMMLETSALLGRQLSTGLTLYSVSFKLQKFVVHAMRPGSSKCDAEWAMATVQANHVWIGQMLQYIVQVKTVRLVHQKLEELKKGQSKPPEMMNRNIQQHYLLSQVGDKMRSPEAYAFIYYEFASLSLSAAEVSVPEMAADKVIKPNPEFVRYFTQIKKLVTSEVNQESQLTDPLHEDSAFSILLEGCPQMNPTLEDFFSVIRAIVNFMSRANQPINDQIYGHIIRRIVGGVPEWFVTRAREYVIHWLRHSIPSIELLCVFLDVKLVTTTQLDQLFFDSLNRQPFNCRLFLFAVRFLHNTLVESDRVRPSDMIASLSLVASTPLAATEQTTEPTKSRVPGFVADLQRILDEMDVPSNVVSSGSKLESLPTFDPNEGVNAIDEINSKFAALKEMIRSSQNVEAILEMTRSACQFGRDFFTAIFFNGDSKDVASILMYVKMAGCLCSSWNAISSAISHCVRGNAMVLKMDMRKYFQLMLAILDVLYEEPAMLLDYGGLLHVMRPLAMPMFTFPWIQLVSDRRFVIGIVGSGRPEGWDVMTTLICDFLCAVVYAHSGNTPGVFDKLYKAVLRFVLCLMHDYPDLMASAAPEFVILVPAPIAQLRNVLLSAVPRNVTEVPPENARKSLASVPGIDLTMPVQRVSKPVHDFADAIRTEAKFGSVVVAMTQKNGSGMIPSFLIFLANNVLPGLNINEIVNAESTHGYFLILQMFEKLSNSPDTVVFLVNAMVDHLRYQSRTTIFFHSTLRAIFKADTQTTGHVGVREIIIRVVLERAVRPAPHPWGLKLFVLEIVENAALGLWESPCITSSEACARLIRKVAGDFAKTC